MTPARSSQRDETEALEPRSCDPAEYNNVVVKQTIAKHEPTNCFLDTLHQLFFWHSSAGSPTRCQTPRNSRPISWAILLSPTMMKNHLQPMIPWFGRSFWKLNMCKTIPCNRPCTYECQPRKWLPSPCHIHYALIVTTRTRHGGKVFGNCHWQSFKFGYTIILQPLGNHFCCGIDLIEIILCTSYEGFRVTEERWLYENLVAHVPLHHGKHVPGIPFCPQSSWQVLISLYVVPLSGHI